MQTAHNELDNIAKLIREVYDEDLIPLHRPIFSDVEKDYVLSCIDSNFVSSAGQLVDRFQSMCCDFTNINFGVATVNGTSALHTALTVVGIGSDDEVITQALTFVATANAIRYTGANPIFLDVDQDTMGLSPKALEKFLVHNSELRDGHAFNKRTQRRIRACIPMHTFGHPLRIEDITEICQNYGISVIEDCAESLGSLANGNHTGANGIMAAISFNGNKIITTGGGGIVLTNNEQLAKSAKHLTTTAKIPHSYDFIHDQVGYNYRMPNINAALGCAQFEKLETILQAKKTVAKIYKDFFENSSTDFFEGLPSSSPNYWLNAIIVNGREERDLMLKHLNTNKIQARPIWRLMSNLSMYKDCQKDELKVSRWLEDRVINLPSSAPNWIR